MQNSTYRSAKTTLSASKLSTCEEFSTCAVEIASDAIEVAQAEISAIIDDLRCRQAGVNTKAL